MDCKAFVHLFMDKNDGFTDRVKRLLDGRDKYPWGNDLGLGKGVIDGMTRVGNVPGGETLAIIHRCENVRIDWLLEGRGQAFFVTVCATDAAAEEALADLLGEENWRVNIITDGKHIAVVLDQPGAFQVKAGKDANDVQQYRWINYTIIEVFTGSIGRATLDLIKRESATHETRIATTAPTMMNMIQTGQFGTYRLVNAPDAVLSGAEKIDATHPIFNQQDPVEIAPATGGEAELLSDYRAMSEENKLAVNQVASAMADYKKAANSTRKK